MIREIQFSNQKNYLFDGIAHWDDDGGAPIGHFEFMFELIAERNAQDKAAISVTAHAPEALQPHLSGKENA